VLAGEGWEQSSLLTVEEGNSRQSVAPDIRLAKRIAKEPPRNTYRLWVEGLPPTLWLK
jgi:hypothetical protein